MEITYLQTELKSSRREWGESESGSPKKNILRLDISRIWEYTVYINNKESRNNMPIEIKVILLFGLCWFIHGSIDLYIKRRVIKIINEKEKRNETD